VPEIVPLELSLGFRDVMIGYVVLGSSFLVLCSSE